MGNVFSDPMNLGNVGNAFRHRRQVSWNSGTSVVLFCSAFPVCLFVVVVFNCDKNTLHEIYPFNRFLSVQHSIVNCKHNVIQHIPKTYLSCVTETL